MGVCGEEKETKIFEDNLKDFFLPFNIFFPFFFCTAGLLP